jgi:hypothetical protein
MCILYLFLHTLIKFATPLSLHPQHTGNIEHTHSIDENQTLLTWYSIQHFKGTVQQKLTGVESSINRKLFHSH